MAKSKLVTGCKREDGIDIYKALESIPCDECNRDIQPGEMFTRFADKNGTVQGIRYTFCDICAPFTLVSRFKTKQPAIKL